MKSNGKKSQYVTLQKLSASKGRFRIKFLIFRILPLKKRHGMKRIVNNPKITKGYRDYWQNIMESSSLNRPKFEGVVYNFLADTKTKIS